MYRHIACILCVIKVNCIHRIVSSVCRQEENIWIIKPWNLGRGLDIHITDNLMQIIRLGQAGPKVR